MDIAALILAVAHLILGLLIILFPAFLRLMVGGYFLITGLFLLLLYVL